MSRRSRTAAISLLTSLVCSAASAQQTASAPKTSGRWEVEAHGGGVFGGIPTGGAPLDQFPVGAAINTGAGTATTRAVSSWYFGDGAALLNQTLETFGVGTRISPLDTAIRGQLADRGAGGSFGFRASRRLTSRFGAEFNFDYNDSALKFSSAAEDAIETADSTFITAWNALLATGATTNRIVTSSVDLEQSSGHQMITTGALTIALGRSGAIEPYATIGAGVVFNRGALLRAALRGNYQFLFGVTFPFNETDVTTVRVEVKDSTPAGVFGGGLKCNLSPRQGLRVDVRVHVSGNPFAAVVDASPSIEMLTPSFAISTGRTPSIQFSTLPASQMRRSSLSGPVVEGLRTFTGSGTQTQVSASIGYSFRF